jgi:hypothetical protein
MKNILIAMAAVATLAVAFAATPNYTSKTGAGTTGLIFPSQRGNQIRIVSANWQSDSNTAALVFTSGQGAYSIAVANTNTAATTNVLNTVTGLAASDVLILEHAGVGYSASVISTNNGTNVATGTFGVAVSVGDPVYKMGNSFSVAIGATTNWQNGEALYVADKPGRPVRAVLSPAATTNRLSISARYE